MSGILNAVIGLVLIAAMIGLRIRITPDPSFARYDFVIVPIFVTGVLLLLEQVKVLAAASLFVGNHATYMWLIHTFLFAYTEKLCMQYISGFFLFYLVQVGITLCVAWLMKQGELVTVKRIVPYLGKQWKSKRYTEMPEAEITKNNLQNEKHSALSVAFLMIRRRRIAYIAFESLPAGKRSKHEGSYKTMNKKYSELAELFRSEKTDKEILDFLLNYHENDIADILEGMSEEERKRLYQLLGVQKTAEIFKYVEEPQKYMKELTVEGAAKVISEMDSDDAVDLLEHLDPEEKEQIVHLLDEDAKKDVKMLLSYDEEEIGSCMTTNYICIPENLSIKQAMNALVKQAGDNDNIMTIYVVDEKEIFAGAIDLKDLIRARENDRLEDLVVKSYPYVTDHEKIDDCMDQILDYAEDSIPVLSSEKKILGVITSEDLIEMVDNEMGEDYAKLAGLTAEEDLKEPTIQSMKKRLPWLIILLFLGMAVSSVVGLFENVVAVLPVVICFQSLVLDMAGNVGTQSLAVTIRVLMDENLTGKQKFQLVVKEVKTGSLNGMLLGVMALLCLGVYVHLCKGYTWVGAFGISGCVGVSLLVAMAISSAVGTVIPMFFHKIKVDPAVASGPLITTVNDLVAVVTYYGLAWLLLIR